ncbi:hypothetical protein NGUA11_04476 [Salmonella enterica]|nr:hypothetical protein NGUA11_04476 [Salmonella enterica]
MAKFSIILRQNCRCALQRFPGYICLCLCGGLHCHLIFTPGTNIPANSCSQFCSYNRNQRIQRYVGNRIKIIRQPVQRFCNGLNTTAQRAISALPNLQN